jgi:hypothetical protein
MEWKVEPTFTIENLANRQRVVTPASAAERVDRERVLEAILALDLKTKLPRLGFTAEMSATSSATTTQRNSNSRRTCTG